MENGYQRRTTTNNNHSRAGTSYSSQSRGTTASNINTNIDNSMAGVKFGIGIMGSKRAQHTNAAMHQMRASSSHRETPLHQRRRQTLMGNGVKKIFETVVDPVTTPLKLHSNSPEEDDVKSADPNSDVAVHSIESHTMSWPTGMNTNDNDVDDGYVDVMNACGQPLAPRHNRENNSASYPQQHQKHQQSSKTVTTTRARQENDPAQTSRYLCLEKSTNQGMIIDEFHDFDDTYKNSSSKSTRILVHYFLFSGRPEVSLIFLCIAAAKRNNPQPPRRSSASTRNSPRLKGTKEKASDNAITIDSSDEGDDTSLSTSADARWVRVPFEFSKEVSIVCIQTQQYIFVH